MTDADSLNVDPEPDSLEARVAPWGFVLISPWTRRWWTLWLLGWRDRVTLTSDEGMSFSEATLWAYLLKEELPEWTVRIERDGWIAYELPESRNGQGG